jgi:hypothetical protein
MISPTIVGQVDSTSLFFTQNQKRQLAGVRSVHEDGFLQCASRRAFGMARFTVAGNMLSQVGGTLTVF